MNTKKFILKRQFLNKASAIFAASKKNLLNLCKLCFAERKILFVTNEKIRTLSLGPVSQIMIIVAIAWIGNVFYQSFYYNQIISDKSQEITDLKNVNSFFNNEFEAMNDKLKKVNHYLISVTQETTPASSSREEIKKPANFNENSLSKSDQHTLNKIQEASDQIGQIKEIANRRIDKIEKTIAMTGLNIKKPKADIAQLKRKYPKLKDADLFSNQGGPLIKISDNDVDLKSFSYLRMLDTAKFMDDIDRLIILEKITQIMPISRPIGKHFITSGFGARIDPITRGMAMHQGLDFVGPNHAKIISPSLGKVILAGKFSDYGNAVVIDHGFGITTRYGHLYQVKVKEGQIVNKGDIIALQGNTGRSTGQHLHYEVRYKNTPLNPRKFIEAGDLLHKRNEIIHQNS